MSARYYYWGAAWVGALDLATLAAGRSGSGLFWGLHQANFFPEGVRWVLFLLPLLFAAAGFLAARTPPPAPARAALPVLLVTAISGVLFWVFRDATHILGDGCLILNETGARSTFSGSAPVANQLALGAVSLGLRAHSLPEHSLALLSVLLGCFFVPLAAWLTRGLAQGPRDAWPALAIFLATPVLYLFFGYVEFYGITSVLALLLMLAALAAMRGRLPVFVPVALWTLALGAHALFVAYAPLAFAPIFAAGLRAPAAERRRAILRAALHLAGGAALGLGLLLLFRVNPADFARSLVGSSDSTLLHFRVRDPIYESYALLDPRHFLDALNEILLVAPLFPLALAWLLARGRPAWDAPALLLTTTAVLLAGALFLLNSRLGMARDWDLYAFPAIPANLLAARVFTAAPGATPAARRWRTVFLAFALGFAFSRTGAWVALNHSDSLSIARARALAAEPRLSCPFSRSYLHEDLSGVLEARQDLRGASLEIARALELRPDHPRLIYRIGYLAYQMHDLDAAEKAFQRSVDLDPNYPDALNGLGLVFASKGEAEKAEAIFRRAIAGTPADLNAHLNLSLLLVEAGRPGEAVGAIQELIAAGGSPPAAYIGRILEAMQRHGDQREARALRALFENRGAR